jgi:hypothetical protein
MHFSDNRFQQGLKSFQSIHGQREGGWVGVWGCGVGGGAVGSTPALGKKMFIKNEIKDEFQQILGLESEIWQYAFFRENILRPKSKS